MAAFGAMDKIKNMAHPVFAYPTFQPWVFRPKLLLVYPGLLSMVSKELKKLTSVRARGRVKEYGIESTNLCVLAGYEIWDGWNYVAPFRAKDRVA